MVNSCAAIGCTNRTKAGSGISFHRFPLSRPELLHKWVRAVRREKWTPNRYSFICSDHFHASCFIVKPGVVGRRLHPDAVPSIFPTLKQYYQSSYKIRRSPVKRKYLSPTKVVKSIATEHSYENHEKVEVGDIVSETDNEIEKLQQRVIKLKEKVKLLNQKLRRQQKKIETLEDLLGNLKEEECISNEQLNLMHHNFEGVAKQLFSDQARNATFDNKTSNRYSQETKQFAMTLHYYSPKAYDFARKVLYLPHPSSIRSWSASVDCEPGFLCDVIKLIGDMVTKNTTQSDVVLIVDAMAIHKGTWWDPKKRSFVGNVDYGTAIPEASDELATEALVFLICGVKGHWKHPVGYFLQNKISADVQAQLIKDCIGLLHNSGLKVVSLVFDGTFGNQSTAVKLGCDMDAANVRSHFPNPVLPSEKVYVIFDVCHMLKLIRNLLADKKTIYTDSNGSLMPIKWEYIEELNNIQQDLGFTLGNKLKKIHIAWAKHKMNVKLAAQTLSSSVATAIDFLRTEAALPEFEGSEHTTKFIRMIDMAFDMLNSRNPHAKGYKSSVTCENFQLWSNQCEKIITYLLSLKERNGSFIRDKRRKTAIWGFVFSIKSLIAISHELLFHTNHPLKYVLTYKFSQDHIELLFNKIRRQGGLNNNPNVQQFKYALQSILLRNSIEPSQTGNCTHFSDAMCESGGLFSIPSKRNQHQQEEIEVTDDIDQSAYEAMLIQLDQESPNELLDNVLYYIIILYIYFFKLNLVHITRFFIIEILKPMDL